MTKATKGTPLRKASRDLYKANQYLRDAADIVDGRPDKIVKRHAKRSIVREVFRMLKI